jgi:uncharacterized protein
LPVGGDQLSGRHPLRLNVGFLLHQNVGFSRVFDFDDNRVPLGEDLLADRLQGEIRFTRTGQGLYGQGDLVITVPGECVRCLAVFDQPLTVELGDLFAYPPTEATDPLLAIPETAILDLTPLVRELALVAMPIRPICREGCKGLCPECGADRNVVACGHRQEEIDPRLAALEGLRDRL